MADVPPKVDSSGVPYRIEGLRNLTDADLQKAIRASSHTILGGDILDEAARRRADRQTLTLVRLTWLIVGLSTAVVVLTVVLLVRTP